ncbi:MAG TPA: NAD-dependent epimerase/dehydratase family protein [Chthoniobacterales bacterium]
MKVLITGVCGFAGSTLATAIAESGAGWTIFGFDNLSRLGSERNRTALSRLGVKLVHGDLRCQSDVDMLPCVDWVIDAAANPSVLAGADGKTSSRQLMEHNLGGTVNMLEKCRADGSGFFLLSTSRVYSIPALTALPVAVCDGAFDLTSDANLPVGASRAGVGETFSTMAPISLYGASKLASEALALEYGAAFNFPVWINRCGVLAGAGQFGRPDQGIFAYWINAHLRRNPLRYIGFDGSGCQVRDCLHPRDILPLLRLQIQAGMDPGKPRLLNVAGGRDSAMSLRQLTAWCDERFGPHAVQSDSRPRPFDLPWVVLDASLAERVWDWVPQTPKFDILEEIAAHATVNPDWLTTTGA